MSESGIFLCEDRKLENHNSDYCIYCIGTKLESEVDGLRKSLDELYGVEFSERSYHALKSRAEKAEELLNANTLLRKRAEGDLEHAHASVVREMNAHNAAWDAAIAEAGKPRGFCSGTNMRNEIVKALEKLKAEALK